MAEIGNAADHRRTLDNPVTFAGLHFAPFASRGVIGECFIIQPYADELMAFVDEGEHRPGRGIENTLLKPVIANPLGNVLSPIDRTIIPDEEQAVIRLYDAAGADNPLVEAYLLEPGERQVSVPGVRPYLNRRLAEQPK